MTSEEYDNSYKDALKLYDNENFDTQDIYESDQHAMHPNMFYQLSQVKGFNTLNGKTYKLYLDNWKTMRKKYK